MAWEDRTPFDAIKYQFGLAEKDVIKIMRSSLKRRSFELWRKRVTDRKTKHKINIDFKNEKVLKCVSNANIYGLPIILLKFNIIILS